MPTFSLLKAIFLTHDSMCENSVFSVLKNFNLAGVLKNKSLISTVVPTGCGVGSVVGISNLPFWIIFQP